MRADEVGALMVLAAALLCWSPAQTERRRRARRVAGRMGSAAGAGPGPPAVSGRASARRSSEGVGGVIRRGGAAAAAGLGVALLVGGAAGVAAGLAVAGAAVALLSRGRQRGEDPAPIMRVALPVACDLLAVCLAAGVPPGAALVAVAAAVPEPLAGELHGVAALYRLGADPGRAWASVAPGLRPVGRIFVRAGESGSSVSPALRALAAELRSEARSSAQARVQRAGIWVLAPLGACFLPAFLCLGVVPLVLGIARDVLG